MKPSFKRPGKAGYISYVMVISTGIILTLSSFYAYRRAVNAREVQTKVQMRVDYAEKEDAVLRSIVAIAPNRAMAAMKGNSNTSGAARNSLRWRNIFGDALNMANARTSISEDMMKMLESKNSVLANVGDSNLTNTHMVFHRVGFTNTGASHLFCASGLQQNLGDQFPAPLTSNNSTTRSYDVTYPIISSDKKYGSSAQGRVGLSPSKYPDFNLIPYPQINFGYAKPGDLFVAKQNWWAFEMDLAGADRSLTKLNAPRRKFVLSIYEIPSQLAISSSAFMSFGRHGSGEDWQNVSIEGGVFAGKAQVEGSADLSFLSSRRGMKFMDSAKVAGSTFDDGVFSPGKREEYRLTTGEFFPVSLASESGRVAFIPINRGAEFFDRFHVNNAEESNAVSQTTWNKYSVGALQCAMSLDITDVDNKNPNPIDNTYKPTVLRFRASGMADIVEGPSLPFTSRYEICASEGGSYDFEDQVVDVAYGANGKFHYKKAVSGKVYFNNNDFGDPDSGTSNTGYWRPAAPYSLEEMPMDDDDGRTRWCVVFYPQRMSEFLKWHGAHSTAKNHSLSFNVDYTTTGLNDPNYNPMPEGKYQEILPGNIPNYALILRECADFTKFEKGFSIVSNLRTYIGDDFNIIPTTPSDTDYKPSSLYYPPVSLFVPERRFGVETDPNLVNVSGQLGSLASDNGETPVSVIDSKGVSGKNMIGNKIKINLRPIEHPAALPPITMINWLVVLEEWRGEYYQP